MRHDLAWKWARPILAIGSLVLCVWAILALRHPAESRRVAERSSMPTVKRHSIDMKRVRLSLELGAESTEKLLAGARRDLTITNSLRNVVRERAGELSVVEPESPEICRDLRLGAEAMAALFKGATCKKAQVEVRLGNETVSVPAGVPSDLQDPGNWISGFFFAVICREYELLDVLCAVPIDLLRSSRTKSLECHYLFVQALQAYWRQEPTAPERLMAALEATAPERVPEDAQDYVLNVMVPQMEMLLYLMDHDAPGFNKALKFALERHQAYFKKDKRPLDSDGYLALGALAMASAAFEAGLAIEVESDYIPKRLVEGACRPQ
jgi:hypothetical protein